MATPIDVAVFKFREIGRREIGKIVRYLPDQNKKIRLPLKLWLLGESRPKSARASLINVLTVLQISSR